MVDGHWLWTGALMSDSGYGQCRRGGRHWLVHRLVWSLLVGELPEELHHDECPYKRCARPACLVGLTKAEHAQVHHPLSSHCSHGHEFTEANTYWRRDRKGRRSRQCRRCNADREQRYKRERSGG